MGEETRPYSPGANSPGEGWFLEDKESGKAVTRAQKLRAETEGMFKQDGMNVDASVALVWKKGLIPGDTKKTKKARNTLKAKMEALEEKTRKKHAAKKAATRTAMRRASLAKKVEMLGQNFTRKAQDARRRSVPFNASMRGSLASAFKKPSRMTKKEAQRVLNAKRDTNLASNLRRRADELEARIAALRSADVAEKARIAEAAKIIKEAKFKRKYGNESENENEAVNQLRALSAVSEEYENKLTAAEENALNKLARRMNLV
jgi:hypothetical protein